MTLLKIAKMGHPVLRRRADPVEDPTAPETRRLIADMVETMQDAQGVGLAAPQIHRSSRVMVFFAPGERGGADPLTSAPLTALINPEITPLGPEMTEDWEGCLSIPGLRGRVPRHVHIGYRGYGSDGAVIEREAKGFHARVVQHEFDHLNGVLYPDRMDGLASLIFESEIPHYRADGSQAEGESA